MSTVDIPLCCFLRLPLPLVGAPITVGLARYLVIDEPQPVVILVAEGKKQPDLYSV